MLAHWSDLKRRNAQINRCDIKRQILFRAFNEATNFTINHGLHLLVCVYSSLLRQSPNFFRNCRYFLGAQRTSHQKKTRSESVDHQPATQVKWLITLRTLHENLDGRGWRWLSHYLIITWTSLWQKLSLWTPVFIFQGCMTFSFSFFQCTLC